MALAGEMAILDALEIAWYPNMAIAPTAQRKIIDPPEGSRAWVNVGSIDLAKGKTCSAPASNTGSDRETNFFIFGLLL